MMSPALHTDYSGLAIERQKSLMASAQNGGTEEIRQTAEDFEAFFLSRMVETMFEGISTDGMFGGGNGEKVFRSLLINEYGKAMAKTGTVGVADYVMKSILEMQEVPPLILSIYPFYHFGYLVKWITALCWTKPARFRLGLPDGRKNEW